MPQKYLQRKDGLHVKYVAKNAKRKNYYASSRPRDIAGAFDWPDPKGQQLNFERYHVKRDQYHEPRINDTPPVPVDFPTNQNRMYYIRKANASAKSGVYNWAFWCWKRALEIASKQDTSRRYISRYEESMEMCRKEWLRRALAV